MFVDMLFEHAFKDNNRGLSVHKGHNDVFSNRVIDFFYRVKMLVAYQYDDKPIIILFS